MKLTTSNQLRRIIERIDCALDPKTGDLVQDLRVALGQIATIREDLPALVHALRLEIDMEERSEKARQAEVAGG